MKKLISLITLLILIMTQLFACATPGTDGDGESVEEEEKEDEGMKEKTYYPSAEIRSAKGGASGIVVLMHDDGDYNTALVIDRLLEKYGLVADCAMVVNKLWDYKTNTPKTEEVAKWRALLDTGRMKMISHSMTHTWWGTEPDVIDITKLTDDPEKIELEIVRSQEVLRELFPDQRVLTFVYPGFAAIQTKYGANSETKMKYVFSENSRKVVSEHYIAGRIGSGSYSIFSTGIDFTTLGALSLSDSQVENNRAQSFILDAKNNKLAVIFSHRVLEVTKEELKDGYVYPNDVSMSVEYYEDMCRVLAEEVAKGRIWNTHYEDAIMYVREVQSAKLSTDGDENEVRVTLTDEMDDEIYNDPLTARLDAADSWEAVKIVQGDRVSYARVEEILWGDRTVDLEIVPDGGAAVVTPIALEDIPEGY